MESFLLVPIFATPVVLLVLFLRSREARRRAAADALHKEQRQADEIHQKRSHQANHGRKVYNWLVKELAQYKDMGIRVDKMEKNGDHFSIFVGQEDGSIATYGGPGYAGHPIIQIDFDFVGRPAPYMGHIHYGAYGADILFWVGDHAPMAGLEKLVLEEVARTVSRLHKAYA